MVLKMGRITWLGKKRHRGGSGTCQGTPHEERKDRYVVLFTEGDEKADDLAKAGAMLDEGFMAEARATASLEPVCLLEV